MMTRNYTRAKAHFFKNLDMGHLCQPEDPYTSNTFTGTKVVGTIGPATQSVDNLAELLDAGMAGARIDLTWGPVDFHRKSLSNLKAAMLSTKRICCTTIDTLGREIMIRRPVYLDEHGWPMHEVHINISQGQRVTVACSPEAEASDNVLPVTYDKFSSMVQPGDVIYIGRYLVCGADTASLYLEVKEVSGSNAVCEALNDAVLDGLMTVFHIERSEDVLLNTQNDLPLLSDYDKRCIAELGAEFDIDYISLSYTRTGEDVREARRFLDSLGMKDTRVIAKVETRQALLNFKSILNECDGIIISRGNLGLDVAPEKMALVQKMLVQSCNLVGKPCLITRVVDTMVNSPRPTRAEATDVANAVMDGVDGILLGAETLRGAFPMEVVVTISKICRQAEQVFDYSHHFEHLMDVAVDLEVHKDEGLGESEGAPSPYASSNDLSSMQRAGASYGHLGTMDSAVSNMVRYTSSHMQLSGLGHSNPAANKSTVSMASLTGSPLMSKLESIASSAVRAADKVCAAMIVVYTASGRTAQLVAKYRPPMPILTLVVPHVVSNGLKWKLTGTATARHCQLSRGLLPMLSVAGPNSDAVLEKAIAEVAAMGLVRAGQHVVCVQQVHEEFCLKIMAVETAPDSSKSNLASDGDSCSPPRALVNSASMKEPRGNAAALSHKLQLMRMTSDAETGNA